jgi:hypothetical protein
MIEMCLKCNKTEIEVLKIAVLIGEIGTIDMPLCAKFRNG